MKQLITENNDNLSVNFIAHNEHIPVRGNAIVSGDKEYDKKIEDELIDRLQRGDIYAWFCAEVYAEWNGIKGESEYLGACSYQDRKDFIQNSCYYDEMKEQAIKNLNEELNRINKEFTELNK